MISAPQSSAAIDHKRLEIAHLSTPLLLQTAGDFCKDTPDVEFVYKNVMKRGSVYTITGKTGCGKTAFLLSLALAVASGRSDILGTSTLEGRVAYLVMENPAGFKERLIASACKMEIELPQLSNNLFVVSRHAPPEEALSELCRVAEMSPFSLIVVDTFQSYFTGDNVDNAMQTVDFMKKMRAFSSVRGGPCVVIAAHPVKNIAKRDLRPSGSGAIMNEVDGNLTIEAVASNRIKLHHDKLRGAPFEPIYFRLEEAFSPRIRTSEGAQIPQPILLRDDQIPRGQARSPLRLLRAMFDTPGATQQSWANSLECEKSYINKMLGDLAKEGLVLHVGRTWAITDAGRSSLR